MEGHAAPDFGMGFEFEVDPNWRSRIREGSRQACTIEEVERSVPEIFGELRVKAVQLDEQIFSTATSYIDYVTKFSVMMESIDEEVTEQLEQIHPGLTFYKGKIELLELPSFCLSQQEPLLPIKKARTSRKCKICGDSAHKRRKAED